MKALLLSGLVSVSNIAYGSVNCHGTIKEIYKWDNFETISIRVETPNQGVTNWLSMPTKSDESMALMAFAAKMPILIHMSKSTITSCIEGWPHNEKLKGYFVIQQQ